MILHVENLNAYYGKAQVLHDITFSVEQGELVALLGKNGVGKTTLLKAIMNIEVYKTGKVIYNQTDITHLKPYQIAQLGILYVPDDTGLFPGMTLLENYLLAAKIRNLDLTPIFETYPKIKELLNRKADQLSGGERKIASVLRALITDAKLLLLDELTEGVAPIMTKKIYETLQELRQRGKTIIAVEPGTKLNTVLQYATKILVLDNGKLVYINTVEKAKEEIKQIQKHLFI